MNRNYKDCNNSIQAIHNGALPSREIPSLTNKLNQRFEQTKSFVYTALPLETINIVGSYVIDNHFAHANTILFGIVTLKFIADLTDRQKIKRLVLDKYTYSQ